MQSRWSRAVSALATRIRGALFGARVTFGAIFGLGIPFMGRPAPALLPAAASGRTIPSESYQEGYYRVLLDWTPEDIRAAVQASTTGYLMLPADLCTAMRGDDRLPAVLSSRVLAVQGAPLTFEAAASGRLRRRALKAAQAEEDFWEMLPEDELEELRSWRRLLFVALGELVWTEPDPADPTGEAVIARIRNGRNVPRLKVWDPRHLRRDMETGRWYVRTRDGHEVEVRAGDGKWILLTAGGSRPWLRGPWRGVADLWLAKTYARQDWARQSERYADGSVYISSPDGTDQDERDLLAADINAAGKRPVLVLPSGFTADVKELQANAWETYMTQWDKADRGMAVAILNNDLSAESKKSANTGAKLQSDVRDDVKKADAQSDVTEIRNQAMCPWALANFGDRELAPWPSYAVEPSEDVQAIATTWNLTAQALATADRAGYEIDWAEVRDATGLPITGKKAPAPIPAALLPGAQPAPGQQAPADKPAADITGAVAALVAQTGDLRAALAEVSADRGAPLSASELRALARLSVPAAARELEQLFVGQRAARERAVSRAFAIAARDPRRVAYLPEGMAA